MVWGNGKDEGDDDWFGFMMIKAMMIVYCRGDSDDGGVVRGDKDEGGGNWLAVMMVMMIG